MIQTPHRFRTKRQLWAYCGLALETRTSANIVLSLADCSVRKKLLSIRGLNRNHNHDLKYLFKSTATLASG
jgi:transposase